MLRFATFHTGVIMGAEHQLRSVFIVIAIPFALIVLGASFFKALIVSFLLLAAHEVNMCSRWISRGTFAVLIVACAVWLGAMPPPSEIKAFAASGIAPYLASSVETAALETQSLHCNQAPAQ